MPRRQPRPWWSAAASSGWPMPRPCRPGRTAYVARHHSCSRLNDVATPTMPARVLGDPAAARVGARGGAGARRSSPRRAPPEPRLGLGPGPAGHPAVELVEALGAEPLGGRDVLGRIGRMARSGTSYGAVVMASRAYDVGGDRQDGAMRVLVAPDKFAGHAHRRRGRRGDRRRAGAAARPTTSSTWRRCRTAGPGFVDVLHAALGGELLAVTVARPVRRAGARRPCWSSATRRTSRARRRAACT